MNTFSVIVPFYNEENCVVPVLSEIIACHPDAEVIAVDDGSIDETWTRICSFRGIRALRLPKNLGQSAAMYAGLRASTQDIVVLMDGDGQNDPSDIHQLLERLKEADVVVGYRTQRKDAWSRRCASSIANRIRHMVMNDSVRDTGCSLKAFPSDFVELLVPFDGMHRYLPAIFTRAGLKIVETPVTHRERLRGTSHYTNWKRGLRGIYDLFGVAWLLNRKIHFPEIETQEPVHEPDTRHA